MLSFVYGKSLHFDQLYQIFLIPSLLHTWNQLLFYWAFVYFSRMWYLETTVCILSMSIATVRQLLFSFIGLCLVRSRLQCWICYNIKRKFVRQHMRKTGKGAWERHQIMIQVWHFRMEISKESWVKLQILV